MISQKPSFEQAMNASILWCKSWEEGNLSDEVLADRIAELIQTKEGARGFFVISLSDNCPLMDRLPDPLIFKLREAGKFIVELTVKNLAMSSAMAIKHQLNHDSKLQENSERINLRCIELLRLLETNYVKDCSEKILNATKGIGSEVKFIERWKYNDKQKLAIAKSIEAIAQT